MIRRPPRSTQSRSSAASDVYKRQPRRDGIHCIGIVGAQEFERLFGEHHAEPPGGAGGILLEQVDHGVRMAPFPEIGEIESARTSADHRDAQRSSSQFGSILRIWGRLIPARSRGYRKNPAAAARR